MEGEKSSSGNNLFMEVIRRRSIDLGELPSDIKTRGFLGVFFKIEIEVGEMVVHKWPPLSSFPLSKKM